MRNYKIGDVFGRLTIQEIVSHPKNPKARCLCTCGTVCFPQLGALGIGKAKSCGCLRRERLPTMGTTHGKSSTPEYKVFSHILERCNKPSCKSYPNYGGRGIRCDWQSFEEFFADMGERPRGGWIERKNNDGPYSKSNCAWVTPAENQKNKRVSKRWVVAGLAFDSSGEAARHFDVDTSTINRRCNGYTRGGVHHPPEAGCYCELKYSSPELPEVPLRPI